jgi:hypothetical protein
MHRCAPYPAARARCNDTDKLCLHSRGNWSEVTAVVNTCSRTGARSDNSCRHRWNALKTQHQYQQIATAAAGSDDLLHGPMRALSPHPIHAAATSTPAAAAAVAGLPAALSAAVQSAVEMWGPAAGQRSPVAKRATAAVPLAEPLPVKGIGLADTLGDASVRQPALALFGGRGRIDRWSARPPIRPSLSGKRVTNKPSAVIAIEHNKAAMLARISSSSGRASISRRWNFERRRWF